MNGRLESAIRDDDVDGWRIIDRNILTVDLGQFMRVPDANNMLPNCVANALSAGYPALHLSPALSTLLWTSLVLFLLPLRTCAVNVSPCPQLLFYLNTTNCNSKVSKRDRINMKLLSTQRFVPQVTGPPTFQPTSKSCLTGRRAFPFNLASPSAQWSHEPICPSATIFFPQPQFSSASLSTVT